MSQCINVNCGQCWNTSFFNPKTWNPKQAVQLAATIVTICAIAITISALMVHYPQASGAFFTAFGIIGGVGSIAFVVALVKYCQQPKHGYQVIQ